MSAAKTQNRALIDRIEQARSICHLVEKLFDQREHENDVRAALASVDVLLDEAGDVVMDNEWDRAVSK